MKGDYWMTSPLEMKTDQPFCFNIAWSWNPNSVGIIWIDSSHTLFNQFPVSPLPDPALLSIDSRNVCPEVINSKTEKGVSCLCIPGGNKKPERNKSKRKERFVLIFLRLLDLLSIKHDGCSPPLCSQDTRLFVFMSDWHLLLESNGLPVRDPESPSAAPLWLCLFPSLVSQKQSKSLRDSTVPDTGTRRVLTPVEVLWTEPFQ